VYAAGVEVESRLAVDQRPDVRHEKLLRTVLLHVAELQLREFLQTTQKTPTTVIRNGVKATASEDKAKVQGQVRGKGPRSHAANAPTSATQKGAGDEIPRFHISSAHMELFTGPDCWPRHTYK